MSMETQIGTFNEAGNEPERPKVKRLHCKECNWILPGIYNWEWEPDDDECRVVYFCRCWRCGKVNTL